MTAPLLPLDFLPPGEWAEVVDLAGESDAVARLAELGLRIGARLRLIRGGSPCLVQVGDGRLSFRMESLEILVQPDRV